MVRFLADASLKAAIVSGCLRREPDMDFLSAQAARLEGVADPEVLARAAEENRVLVTHDFGTMPRHFGDFVRTRPSSGVILVSQATPVAQVIDALTLIWAGSDAEEWLNRILKIPPPPPWLRTPRAETFYSQ